MKYNKALEILTIISRKAPNVIVEWCKAHPSEAHVFERPVGLMCKLKHLGWNGPYLISIGAGGRRRAYSLFFKNVAKTMEWLLAKQIEQEEKGSSQPKKRTFICPECGAAITVYEYPNIFVDDRPVLKKMILDGELFRYRCPNCHLSGVLQYETIYFDNANRLTVHLVPDKERRRGYVEAHFYERLAGLYSTHRCRIVQDVEMLRETIRIRDDGFDDVIINILKIYAHGETGFNCKLVYNGCDSTTIAFKRIGATDGKGKWLRIGKAGHQRMQKYIKAIGVDKPGEFLEVDNHFIFEVAKRIEAFRQQMGLT